MDYRGAESMSTRADSDSTFAKILIAEDSPTQAQALRHVLEQHGYEIGVAGNGREAMDMAVRLHPALIISDVIMPEMDGFELCRRIKAEHGLCDIPVILVTTMSDPADVIRGLECGADNFVLKPYDERYLLGRVQYVLANRDLHQVPEARMGVELFFNDKKHYITAGRLQILNLLLSTYDAAIQRNKELQHSREELQLVNAKLAAANQELEAFSYSVSHDLRAPLRHVQGYVELLTQATAASQLSEKAQHYLQTITDASIEMGRLIDDLLAFSRMGQIELHESRVQLNGLVQVTVRDLEMATQGRNIDWNIAPLPQVFGDSAMIKQLFANLIGNAVKYSRPRDPAQIEIGCAGEEDGRVILFVRDNGVGFDMQYAHKLFGVFQRLHRATEFEGTGIGLAIVRRVIDRHGGRVWAESAVNRGATFYFTLQPATNN
jgi:hypothetical protein